jgi:hypothetical protein
MMRLSPIKREFDGKKTYLQQRHCERAAIAGRSNPVKQMPVWIASLLRCFVASLLAMTRTAPGPDDRCALFPLNSRYKIRRKK